QAVEDDLALDGPRQVEALAHRAGGGEQVVGLAQVERRAHAGTTSTGMPLSTALPDSTSNSSSSASRLEFTPAWAVATAISTPGRSWPHPCGRQTTPGMTASVTSTAASKVPVRDDTRATPPSAR